MNTFFKRFFRKLKLHYSVYKFNKRVRALNKTLPENAPVSEDSPRIRRIIEKLASEYKE